MASSNRKVPTDRTVTLYTLCDTVSPFYFVERGDAPNRPTLATSAKVARAGDTHVVGQKQRTDAAAPRTGGHGVGNGVHRTRSLRAANAR
jgi:hypothetical protein